MTKPTNNIIEIKLADILIEYSSDGKYCPLAGRTLREIKDNAKLLKPELEAAGKWDQFQPGQVFEDDDGKFHLLAGFTRHAAATELGWETGWFGVDDSDPVTRALKCITTNGGRPVSRASQGKTYAMMTVGVAADDFAGATADPKNPDNWKIPPMSIAEIAERIGKSDPLVRQNIAIAEAPPEFAELLETDQIASIPYLKAAAACGINDNFKSALCMRWCLAAIKVAGGKTATQKHFDVVKAEFIKLKAVSAKGGGKTPPAAPGTQESGKEKGQESIGHVGDSGDSGSNEGVGNETPSLDLSSPAPTTPKQPTKKDTDEIRKALRTVIMEWDEKKAMVSLADDDIDDLIDRLVDAKLNASHLPF